MARLIASFFGTGLILRGVRGSDAGSGTVASVFAFPVAVLLGGLGPLVQVLSVVAVIGLAYWSVSTIVGAEGDAGWIVIDEAAGTFVAVIAFTWLPGLVALVVFRAADIFKGVFPGVATVDRAPGALGVVGDDLVAGLYGLAAGLAASLWVF